MMKRIALHACCAPCTTIPGRWLSENGFKVELYWYNPNIYPEAEYVKRYFVLKEYSKTADLPLVFDFDNAKTEPGNCAECYKTRLLKTAEYAKNTKADCFSTTLLISPYQNHGLIKKIGQEIGNLTGVEFFYRDFRKNYAESRKVSRELKLYLQKWCGCRKSIRRKKIDQAQKVAA